MLLGAGLDTTVAVTTERACDETAQQQKHLQTKGKHETTSDKLFHALREHPGRRPGILILDLLTGKDVRVSVERFRQTNTALKDIPRERIFCLARESSLTPDDLPGLHNELRGVSARALADGIDVLHYFHAGPACVAAVRSSTFIRNAIG